MRQQRTINVSELTLAKNIDRMFGMARKVDRYTEPNLKFMQKEGHSVCVEHTEYLGDVNGSVGFTNTTYNINPGNAGVFPQLVQLAALYEEYCFTELTFEYRPQVFDQLSNSDNAGGVVGMVVQYNASDLPFLSKLQAENYERAESVAPWNPILHHVDVTRRVHNDNVLSTYYVRVGSTVPVTGISDIRLYDIGVLNLWTYGQNSSVGQLGELWVRYKVCFYKNRPVQSTVAGIVLGADYNTGSTRLASVATTDMFGSATIANVTAASNLLLDFSVKNQINIQTPMPVGSFFLIVCKWTAATAQSWTATTLATPTGSGLSSTNVTYFPNATKCYINYASSSGTQYGLTQFVYVTGQPDPNYGLYMTFSGQTFPGVNLDCSVSIFQLSEQFLTHT